MTDSIAADDQSAVIALLLAPATHAGQVPRRIDTHGAVVFLAGPRAYKLKRAVVYPFLDYRTRELRRQALETELAVNRPLAPTIYDAVLPVTRDAAGSLRLGGAGPAVDYVLAMHRFDEEQTLDRVVARRVLSDHEVDGLAAAVLSAHASAGPADGAAWIADLGTYVAQNEAALLAYPGIAAAPAVQSLCAAARAALARITGLLALRAQAGFVRRCHGDLHLGNVALLDGAPTLFDAIEFDPRVAAGDLLYDLAFLLMDLSERGHVPAANRLLNRYLAGAREPRHLDGLAALPFFLHLRAAIRAKVTAARADLLPLALQAAALAEARRYLDFAARALAPARPRLVAVGGLSGTGKTGLAYGLAPQLSLPPGAVVIRSDVERKALFGVAETDRLPESAYSAAASDAVFGRVADAAARALGAGCSVVCDAVYARRTQRDAIAAVAATAGVPFTGLWLELPLAVRLARIAARRGDASDADAAVARRQAGYDVGALGSWITVDASGAPAEVVALALRSLGAG